MEYPNSVPDNPLVSVCIQTYNHAPYIAQCIEGALMQETDFPYEIIIGEDESTDGTREICIEYAKKYPGKIRLFLRSEEDKIWIDGVKTGRFNFVENLKAARGKYVALSDGDDYWINTKKLKNQIQILEANNQIALCCHNAIIVNKDGQFIQNFNLNEIKSHSTIKDVIEKKWFIPTASIVFRKQNIGKLPKWFMQVINGDFSLQLLATIDGKEIFYLQDIYSAYRLHEGGLSQQLKDRIFLNKALIKILLKFNLHSRGKYRRELKKKVSELSSQIVKISSKKNIDFWKYFLIYIWSKNNRI